MNAIEQDPALPLPPPQVAEDLVLGDLGRALAAGWRDFLAMPQFGIFFGGFYVLAGLAMGGAAIAGGEPTWLIPAMAGFPLVAPFVAVGLYEASRRREAGEAPSWRAVLGALKGHGDDQILSMGVIVFVAFSFWMIVAHAIFAVFMAESGMGGESVAALLTPAGLTMLAVGSAVGAVMAFAFYAMTVISLPMLVERKVDFLTAIIASFKVVRTNLFVMLAWAAIIAAVLFAAMIPAFLGLMVALPVLGHATWHLYRGAIA
ncbi:DUF2189 domain-containing protein [Erythrobacter dokdonensis]|jgi:uncharacterized membrane protein|uniref:Membrane protein n=1 Tax=Erythrobacter dokdonensis DSW-74 TaxID=1300349 RepID=A0A1A7BKZ0_9SPHN|nr:DUF2189 domain-containing protein [Erythrobacter dokdonensis]MEE4316188.1 DUF2189 domain-containing protein [Erythrobacter sp.]OBV11825.1 Membrane protein [Erythrobacter dokdonensis DSW-74]